MPGPRLDLVVPVFNALRETRNCLRTVRRFAPPWARVIVINDGSDAVTTAWLREQSGFTLLENAENLGFVKTANRGLTYSDAPYVCLLNSDTLLTEGALERMVARLDREPGIGMCCPLSNEAVNLSVKLPPGENVFSFASKVTRSSPALYPDAVTIVGFCLLIRREVLSTLGVLDEAFGRGYCEETDLHYRARAAGWRCVVADDTFVYHRKGASFRDGDERMWANMKLLMSRWQALHEKELAAFDAKNALGAVRDVATYEWTAKDPAKAVPYDVLFVLPMMGVFGGVADVLELANALVLEGLNAGVVLLEEIPHRIDLELFFRPLQLAPEHFVKDVPDTMVLVATAYQTVPPVAAAAARRPGMQTAYFVQDYEGWFETDGVDYVSKTYDLIPRLTTISTWLSKEIGRRHGHSSAVVPMSADPEHFYPRGERPVSPVRVVAMLRVDERRGAKELIGALEAVFAKSAPGAIEVVLFGSAPVPRGVRFPFEHRGILTRDSVATILASAHVVVDPSHFQGFGLVGLEGMASGACCVLTRSGGAGEYAVDGVNCIEVEPKSVDALAAGILRAVTDSALRERQGAEGRKTALGFTWKGAARRYREFLAGLPKATAKSPSESAALELLWTEILRQRKAPPPPPAPGSFEDRKALVKQSLAHAVRRVRARLSARRPGVPPGRDT